MSLAASFCCSIFYAALQITVYKWLSSMHSAFKVIHFRVIQFLIVWRIRNLNQTFSEHLILWWIKNTETENVPNFDEIDICCYSKTNRPKITSWRQSWFSAVFGMETMSPMYEWKPLCPLNPEMMVSPSFFWLLGKEKTKKRKRFMDCVTMSFWLNITLPLNPFICVWLMGLLGALRAPTGPVSLHNCCLGLSFNPPLSQRETPPLITTTAWLTEIPSTDQGMIHT